MPMYITEEQQSWIKEKEGGRHQIIISYEVVRMAFLIRRHLNRNLKEEKK